MPKLWPFSRKSDPDPDAAFRAAEAELRARFEAEVAAGHGRQAILHAIEEESRLLEQAEQTAEVKGRLRAYDLLYSEIRPRMFDNLTNGKNHEMAGRVDDAIACYETAVLDKVPTRFRRPQTFSQLDYQTQRAANGNCLKFGCGGNPSADACACSYPFAADHSSGGG